MSDNWGEGFCDKLKKMSSKDQPLKTLGNRLAEILDDDQWAQCEGLLLEVLDMYAPPEYKYPTFEDWWTKFGKIFDYDIEEEQSICGFFKAFRELK